VGFSGKRARTDLTRKTSEQREFAKGKNQKRQENGKREMAPAVPGDLPDLSFSLSARPEKDKSP
jgi:hypothetical protein